MSFASGNGGFAVIVTALDETWSVRETVERIVADNSDDVTDIVMAIAPHTTAECRAVIDEMEVKFPGLVRRHEQNRLPGVGGAIQECAELVTAEWTLLMASDLETPPEAAKAIIARAKQGEADIVSSSRWAKDGSFGDYSRIKRVCNWIFQKVFSALYLSHMTDMTYGYRAYRTELLRRYRWHETGLAFFFESLVKPLRDGRRIVEVPVRWQRRKEGVSHVKSAEFWRYFRIGLTVRFASRKSLLRDKGSI